MVLTQSCDLVRRGKKSPKAPYITVAAMRPAQILIDRQIRRYALSSEGVPIMLCRKEYELSACRFVERLLNNTEDNVFFIRKDAHPALRENYCVFLPLSISLRAEQYDVCLAAKIAQLNDVFQAKVGWLTSNMYGRVGTPDIADWVSDPGTYKKALYEEVLYSGTVWLSARQYAKFMEEVERRGCDTDEDVEEILGSIRDDIEEAADEIVELLSVKNLLAGDGSKQVKRKVANVLLNSKPFRRSVVREEP
jgi:hypothetical protein